MNDVPARLVVKHGPNPEQEYSLAPVEVTIGRSSNNVITIADPEISRRHACIRSDGGRYFIEDWGSTNGTFVNDQRINNRVMLFNEDEIRLGDKLTLQFLTGQEGLLPESDYVYRDTADAVTIVESTPQAKPEEAVPEEAVWEEAPVVPAAPAVPATQAPSDQFIVPEQDAARSQFRLRLLGCGCGFLLIIFLCMAMVYFLDAYQGGRLLYCGPLRPIFEITLGPFGFAPLCT